MLINRYFDAGAREIGSGRVSQRLLRIFGRNSMSYTRGSAGEPAQAAYRAQICQLFDDRLTPARKLAAIHRMMQADKADARAVLDRIEKLLASLTDADRAAPGFQSTLAAIARDTRTGERVIATARATAEPAMRVRLVSLAATLGWLTPESERAEHARMVTELLARNAMGFAEVDLICALGRDGALEAEIGRVSTAPSRASAAGRAAALACMGSASAHAEVVRALASGDVRDVQVAQAYLRNRPVTDPAELRAIAESVTRMPPSEAQVRAFEALGRLQIADRQILEELSRAFAGAKSLGVQRAIAEVFIRSGYRGPELAEMLRRTRLRSPEGRPDLIDTLIHRLQAVS
jgi:dihydroxyacetone kinase DhaKLM complex PTS-EIIA-like component DhaM